MFKSFLAEIPGVDIPAPFCPWTAKYALKDCVSGDVYPLPRVTTWADAFLAARDAEDGIDVGLLVPPRPGSAFCPTLLPSAESRGKLRQWREQNAAEVADAFRGVGLLPRYAPKPPVDWYERGWAACATATPLIVLLTLAAAWALLGRR